MRFITALLGRFVMFSPASIFFTLLYLATVATGYAYYGPEGNLAAQYIPAQAQNVFSYINPEWFDANKMNIFYALNAIGFVFLTMVVASPYMLRGSKAQKHHERMKLNSVEFSLFPLHAAISAPAMLAFAFTLKDPALFTAQSAELANLTGLTLVSILSFDLYIRHIQGILVFFFKRGWERDLAMTNSGAMVQAFQDAGFSEQTAQDAVAKMAPGDQAKAMAELQAVTAATAEGEATTRAAEEARREASNRVTDAQSAVDKRLKKLGISAERTGNLTGNTGGTTGPVVIEIPEDEAPAEDAPAQEPAKA